LLRKDLKIPFESCHIFEIRKLKKKLKRLKMIKPSLPSYVSSPAPIVQKTLSPDNGKGLPFIIFLKLCPFLNRDCRFFFSSKDFCLTLKRKGR